MIQKHTAQEIVDMYNEIERVKELAAQVNSQEGDEIVVKTWLGSIATTRQIFNLAVDHSLKQLNINLENLNRIAHEQVQSK